MRSAVWKAFDKSFRFPNSFWMFVVLKTKMQMWKWGGRQISNVTSRGCHSVKANVIIIMAWEQWRRGRARFRAANVKIFCPPLNVAVGKPHNGSACQIGESQGRACKWACDMHTEMENSELHTFTLCGWITRSSLVTWAWARYLSH